MSEALFVVGDIIMFTAVVGVIVFTVSYALFFAWSRTHAGQALMYFAGSLALWGVQSFISRLNPEYPGREWVRIGIYLMITVTVWGLVVTLWRYWGRPLSVEARKRKEL